MQGFKPSKQTQKAIAIGMLVLPVVSLIMVAQARDLNVRVNRALILQNLKGQVTFWQRGSSRAARSSDRLQAIGDGVSTGKNSSVVLAIDLGIGQVNVAAQTRVNVQELSTTPNGGRITRLSVPAGQVRFQVRRFSAPDSRLEIETPAGVAGVRGTQFGMNIQPNGKTSVATLEGSVASSAQGKRVLVEGGFQSFTIPGEPPSDPVPLRNDPSLTYEFVRRLENGVRRLWLEGQVDPVNRVFVEEIERNVDRNGRFRVELDAISFPQVRVTVITPLGRRRDYALAFR